MKTLMVTTLLIMLLFAIQCPLMSQSAGFEPRVTLITLSVADMQKSADFYENVLGWQRADISGSGIYFYRLNGIILALTPNDQLALDAQIDPSGSGFNQLSMAYYTRSKEEVDHLMTSLSEIGADIVLEPSAANWGGYRGYFTDPDGFLWEVVYNPLDPAWDKTCR